MKTAIIKYYNIIPSIDTQKEDQVILFRSPDFCLKPQIYRYLSKTDHPGGAGFVPRSLFNQIEIWSTDCYHILIIRSLDLVVSNKMFSFIFYLSM